MKKKTAKQEMAASRYECLGGGAGGHAALVEGLALDVTASRSASIA